MHSFEPLLEEILFFFERWTSCDVAAEKNVIINLILFIENYHIVTVNTWKTYCVNKNVNVINHVNIEMKT